MKIRKLLNFPLIGRFDPGYIQSAKRQFIDQNAGELPNRIELPPRVVSEGMQEHELDMHKFESMYGMEIIIVPDQRDDMERLLLDDGPKNNTEQLRRRKEVSNELLRIISSVFHPDEPVQHQIVEPKSRFLP
jgi:hypothetical protein